MSYFTAKSINFTCKLGYLNTLFMIFTFDCFLSPLLWSSVLCLFKQRLEKAHDIASQFKWRENIQMWRLCLHIVECWGANRDKSNLNITQSWNIYEANKSSKIICEDCGFSATYNPKMWDCVFPASKDHEKYCRVLKGQKKWHK